VASTSICTKEVAWFQFNRLRCYAATFNLSAAIPCTDCGLECSLQCYALLFRFMQLFLQLLDAYPKLVAVLRLLKAATMILRWCARRILTEIVRSPWVRRAKSIKQCFGIFRCHANGWNHTAIMTGVTDELQCLPSLQLHGLTDSP